MRGELAPVAASDGFSRHPLGSKEVSAGFHLSVKMCVSLAEMRHLKCSAQFDKQLFQEFQMPWVDILNF